MGADRARAHWHALLEAEGQRSRTAIATEQCHPFYLGGRATPAPLISASSGLLGERASSCLAHACRPWYYGSVRSGPSSAVLHSAYPWIAGSVVCERSRVGLCAHPRPCLCPCLCLSPLSLIESALVFAAALVPLWIAVLTWRHAGRLAARRARHEAVAWRVWGAGYALWALALVVLGSLSLVYPFTGRVIILPPGVRTAAVVEAVAYTLVPTGLVVLVVGRVLLHRAYHTYAGAGEGRRRGGGEEAAATRRGGNGRAAPHCSRRAGEQE